MRIYSIFLFLLIINFSYSQMDLSLRDSIIKYEFSNPNLAVEFGLKYIEEHDISSVMGMLAENAYPDQYRIFQFRSKNGSKNFQKIEQQNLVIHFLY